MNLTGEKLGPSDTEVRVGWVYQLKKPELITALSELELDSEGNVDELRARLVKYYRSKEAPAATSLLLPSFPLQMEVSEKKIPRGPPPPESSRENRATHPEVETLTAAQICDKVRKWGVKFDGTQDSMAFLERIDELRECYGFTEADLLLALPELLKGKALLWYRNHKQTWRNWTDVIESFKVYFLPQRYQYTLEEEIRNRIQRSREPATEYVTDILTLMRRHGNMSNRSQLERIHENLQPEYKHYVRLRDFNTLTELLELAGQFEKLPRLTVQESRPTSSQRVRFDARPSSPGNSRPGSPDRSGMLSMRRKGPYEV
uniref:Retrotransposon gag domain-containing protein n=2 Tax=Photinus pyralis TaxID=7054 RepID=A0A1Y1MBR5_PHOPY